MIKKFISLTAALFLFACTGLPKFSADAENENPADGEDGQGEADVTADDSRDPRGDDPQEEEAHECSGDRDCGDGIVCNGVEVCNLETHTCGPGAPPADGFVCGSDPRRICLSGACVQSFCGDGFVDVGAGEECDSPDDDFCQDCMAIYVPCMGDDDCPDDGSVCNGDEYCNPDHHLCARRNVPEEGTVCQNTPRMICVGENCQPSVCGDGFVDSGAVPPEECEDANAEEGDGCDNDCRFSCHGSDECNDGHDCTQDSCSDSHTCDHTPSPTATLCRPAEGVCDAPEYCTSSSLDCPPDRFAPEGAVCSDGDPCTDPDGCDGAGTCTGEPVAGCSCAAAKDVTSLRSWSGSFSIYTNSWTGGAGCRTASGPEAWFMVTVAGGERLLVEETSGTDVVLHRVSSCGTTTCQQSEDFDEQLEYYNATGSGVTLIYIVEGYYVGEGGPFDITVNRGLPGPGYTCATAVDITSLTSWSGSFRDYGDHWSGGSGCSGAYGPEIWFTATVRGGGSFSLSETTSTDVVLHRVASCGSTVCISSVDDPDNFSFSNPALSPVTLYLIVEKYFSGFDESISLVISNI